MAITRESGSYPEQKARYAALLDAADAIVRADFTGTVEVWIQDGKAKSFQLHKDKEEFPSR